MIYQEKNGGVRACTRSEQTRNLLRFVLRRRSARCSRGNEFDGNNRSGHQRTWRPNASKRRSDGARTSTRRKRAQGRRGRSERDFINDSVARELTAARPSNHFSPLLLWKQEATRRRVFIRRFNSHRRPRVTSSYPGRSLRPYADGIS